MPRPLSTAMLAWLNGSVLPVALFFEGTFVTGTVYMWTGYGSITWNGNTWLGIGTMGGVTTIDEGSTVEAKGIAVTLSGFDATTLANVLGEFQLGLPMTVYLVGFNDGAIIDNPLIAFSGRMDKPDISVDGTQGKIQIACESRLLDMNVAVDRRYTADDQQRDWPGDLGFNSVNSIQEMTIYFGTAPTTSANV
jgi:hypothetical protein